VSGTLFLHPPEVHAAGGTQSAERVAEVLLAVADDHPRAGVSDIARQLGLSKAVVHRILRSLAQRDLLAPAPGGAYRLGPAAAGLGAAVLRDLDLRAEAMPSLRSLATRTGETATLSALVGNARLYLEQVVSVQQIRMEVQLGRRFPLHAGASGKAILAAAPEDLCRRILESRLEPLTPRTLVDPTRLRRELRRINRTGIAISRGERQPGAGSVAAAVFGLHGDVVGAVSVCGPAARFDEATCARLAPVVSAAAAEIDARLGAGAIDGTATERASSR
jgi:IclR family transcriptional regulator, acetate operon repressor